MAWPVAEAESSERRERRPVRSWRLDSEGPAWRAGKVASGGWGLPDRTQKIGQTQKSGQTLPERRIRLATITPATAQIGD